MSALTTAKATRFHLGEKKLCQLKYYLITVHKYNSNTKQLEHINTILMQLMPEIT